MPVTGSKRSAVGALTDKQWSRLRASVRRNAGRRTAALLPTTPPSRGQYLYAEEHLLAPNVDVLQGLFERRAIQQALEQGLFPIDTARNWCRPERRQLLVGDATVPKAPSKAEHTQTVDTTTGELRTHRVDPAARLYYENGEKEKTVARGTKWFFASGRDTGYWRRPGVHPRVWPRALDGMTGVTGSTRVQKAVASARGHLAAFRRKGGVVSSPSDGAQPRRPVCIVQ
ncbi:hypothetical protein [Streptomyces sp. BRA346]|uniref:hypothetical protein n=1 Tax=Streptomyces sp. BRA346 TaxID=2878199 RepID=UPI00406315A9